jgi:hypothetical protein
MKFCYSVVFGNRDRIFGNRSQIFGQNRIFGIGNAAEYSVSAEVENSGFVRSLVTIPALSAHLAAEFNISPGRWQHVWLVSIVPPKRWGKID